MTAVKPARQVVCMGSINMDLVMYVEHLPKPGETIVTDNFHTFPGGKGGNQAATVGKLGGSPIFLGKLGADHYSETLKESLSSNGVDVSQLFSCDETAGIAIILVDNQGQNSISFTPGANALLTKDEIYQKEALFKPGNILLATFEIGVELVYEAAKLAKENDMLVIVDPAPMGDLPSDFSNFVDVIVPNETEAEILVGDSIHNLNDAIFALKKLKELGYSSPIITLGDQGVIYFEDDEAKHVSPHVVEAIDSTAAGDVFAGALAFSLANEENFSRAIAFANVAAALSTTVAGAQTSIPDLELIISKNIK